MTTQMSVTKDKSPLPSQNGHAATEPTAEGRPPALPLDLAALSDEAIAVLAVEAPREFERRKARIIDSLREHARALGIAPERLAAAIRPKTAAAPGADSARDGRTTVRPLYRNSNGETWAGRGKPPAWVEFGDEINPVTGKPLPLRKFWITEPEK